MNGDIGKLPSGVVYHATPECLATSSPADYSSLNGIADSLDTYAEVNTAPGGMPGDSSALESGIPLDQLKQMLSSQLEYYFSRENLANDAYLLSQMDNDQYVPIWTVANFNQVKKLTKDIKLITEVLRESPNVQVDEEGLKVRPNHKRCIVILREIPANTPIEEVKALFSGEACPKFISCEFAHNNSWYVTFESDEDAQRAYRFLREEVKEFQGKPIMARIKAKPMNRLPMPPVPAMGAVLKNGYRTPPTAVYDPNPYQPQQQSFVFTNGSSVASNVSYGNQVHVYPFQQQQFYPNVLQSWNPARPAYFDIGSVFSVNGLAPQGSFTKSQSTRYIPRNRNKRSGPGSDRASLPDTSMMRPITAHSYHHLSGAANMISGATSLPVMKAATGAAVKMALPIPPSISVDNHQNHSKNHQATIPDGCEIIGIVPSQHMRADSDDGLYRHSIAKEQLPPRYIVHHSTPSLLLGAFGHRRRRKEEENVPPLRPTVNVVVNSIKPPITTSSPQPVRRELTTTTASNSTIVTTTVITATVTTTAAATVSVTMTTAAAAAPLPPPPPPPTVAHESRGAQFDLEGTAFPPLPALDTGSATVLKNGLPLDSPQCDTNSQWESRLSDVVKGTAKIKTQNTNCKEKDTGCENACSSPCAVSPSPPPLQQASHVPTPSLETETKDVGTNSDNGFGSIAPTPPSSPEKSVPVAKCMADKSTKTEETITNGEATGNSTSRPSPDMCIKSLALQQQSNSVSGILSSKCVPTTTNAATMTSAVVVTDISSASVSSTKPVAVSSMNTATSVCGSLEPVNSSDVAGCATRLSYAQVAQHHKENVERLMREKQHAEQQEKEKERKKEPAPNSRTTSQHHTDARDSSREFRDPPARFAGRGGPRGTFERDRGERSGARRRDGSDRGPRFAHPRSPK